MSRDAPQRKDIKDRLRIALLISGDGTTAQEIIRACKSRRLGAQPACIIASRPDAGGIQKALQEGMLQKDVLVIARKDYETTEAFGEAILKACSERAVDIIGQYGWMPKTPANVIEAYSGRMINQHPGPLDPGRLDFGGKDMFGRRVHCARLYYVRQDSQDFWTEATAQRVAAEYDLGAVLKTKRIEILPDDDPISLQQRVLPAEHEVQIETLQDFANGRVQEIVREHPLVPPEKESLLAEAKRIAISLFPHG